MDITVVVPTYRRPASLARLLAGLAAQAEAPPYQLVVVDNDPEPHPEPALPAGARLVREPVPGSAAARNRGIAETETPLLAMLDDDVVPGPDWLRTLAEPVLAGRADVTGGRVQLDPGAHRPSWLSPAIEGYLTALDLGADEAELTGTESLLTANLLTRTQLLRDIGGFDADLGPRPGKQLVADDVLLVRRLRDAGARAVWVPHAVVVHELPDERLHRRWLLRRAFLQGRSDWRVDRAELQRRKANGGRVALAWWLEQARLRRAEGVRDPAVAFHAACDLARTLGAVAEAASWRSEPAARDGLSP